MYDDGTNNPYGGFPYAMCAPVYQDSGLWTGANTGGTYGPGTNSQLYTWLEITDTGTEISVRVQGIDTATGASVVKLDNVSTVQTERPAAALLHEFYTNVRLEDITPQPSGGGGGGGEMGPVGPQGPPGASGPAGAPGPTGPAGPAGVGIPEVWIGTDAPTPRDGYTIWVDTDASLAVPAGLTRLATGSLILTNQGSTVNITGSSGNTVYTTTPLTAVAGGATSIPSNCQLLLVEVSFMVKSASVSAGKWKVLVNGVQVTDLIDYHTVDATPRSYSGAWLLGANVALAGTVTIAPAFSADTSQGGVASVVSNVVATWSALG
jgi:hypothetical protein